MTISSPQDLIVKWRAKAAATRSWHATMGTGWEVCADELEAALSAVRPPQQTTDIRETIRLAFKRLRDRVEAIRSEAINPARARGFDIGWQLGRLRDDVENMAFALMREAPAADPLRGAGPQTVNAELLPALKGLLGVIDAAGLLNLSNGVQLGQTSWYVKASAQLEWARDVIAKAEALPGSIPSPEQDGTV